jgi:hypothetical protein
MSVAIEFIFQVSYQTSFYLTTFISGFQIFIIHGILSPNDVNTIKSNQILVVQFFPAKVNLIEIQR